MKLDKITGEVFEQWIDTLFEQGKKNVTINGYFGTLMTMMKWAVRKRFIDRDPFLDVQKLLKEPKEKKIITHEKFKALFVTDWKKAWDNDLLMCTANKLAALTSMRSGEVLGLKGEFVFDDHLHLCAQYDDYGYRKTKTNCLNNYFPLNENCTKGQYQTCGGEVIFEYMTESTGFRLPLRFRLFFLGGGFGNIFEH